MCHFRDIFQFLFRLCTGTMLDSIDGAVHGWTGEAMVGW